MVFCGLDREPSVRLSHKTDVRLIASTGVKGDDFEIRFNRFTLKHQSNQRSRAKSVEQEGAERTEVEILLQYQTSVEHRSRLGSFCCRRLCSLRFLELAFCRFKHLPHELGGQLRI